MGDRSGVVSSFTVIKGALVSETYEAFRHWDLDADRRTNIARLKELNVFGAQSSSWLRDLGKVLNRRFDPDGRDRALVRMAQAGVDLAVWRPALLWHMTRDEFLVRDFLIHWLEPRFSDGTFRIHVEDVIPFLAGIEERGLTQDGKSWSDPTRRRVASGLLGIAADLGLLRGTAVKEFGSHHLPDEAFLYVLHAIAELEPNGTEVIGSPEWQMFLHRPEDVEQEILRLHQFRRLHYERAGSIVALSLPFEGAAEYAESLCA
ncbi:MAG TPA: BrxA family protein [Bryobacteraceae bacterium]|nr:BrxA family protein [Bryobacteraceae bacterium]